MTRYLPDDRRRKQEGEHLTNVVKVRFTDAELADIEQAAEMTTGGRNRAKELVVIDRQVIALAVANMSPDGLRAAQVEAAQRRMTVEDVVLEVNLRMVQDQLYALRQSAVAAPSLTVIEGGRA